MNCLRELCEKLVKCEDEKDVVKILEKKGLWKSEKDWELFGRKPNNYSTIGNQQNDPIAALVEKVVNSMDHVLLGKAKEKGINPEGKDAPRDIKMAVEQFFGVERGDLGKLSPQELNLLSNNIIIQATGKKSTPCITIIDKGEGQTPNSIERTILSIGESNKLSIPFVQGKFNMGGTGSLNFCGDKRIQLIVTRKNPHIEIDDESKDCWAFTVIRREDPRKGWKSSAYTYLKMGGEIPSFEADDLKLLPTESSQNPEPYKKVLEYGTFIKHFDYKAKGYTGKLTGISGGLVYRLGWMIDRPPLPFKLVETRDYPGRTKTNPLAGLYKLDSNIKKNDNIEDDFPANFSIKVDGEEIIGRIYAFKPKKAKTYREKEGIIFSVNGQCHGTYNETFFSRKRVGMDYLKDSLLVVLDCSNLSIHTKENLFMNSRDRLRSSDFSKNLERQLEQELKDNYLLRELRDKRRQEKLSEKVDDNKELSQKLGELLEKIPSLSSILDLGIEVPADLGEKEGDKRPRQFEGLKIPTLFRLKRVKDGEVFCKTIQDKTKSFKLQLETDAENEFFIRSERKGYIEIYLGDEKIEDYSVSLFGGVADLRLKRDGRKLKVGKQYLYGYKIRVEAMEEVEFQGEFRLDIVKNKDAGKPPKKKNDKGKSVKDDKKSGTKGAIPNINEIHREEWKDNNMNEKSCVKIISAGDDGYDFFINMDNLHLVNELRKHKSKPEMIEAKKKQFKLAMTLFSLVNLNAVNEKQGEESEVDIDKEVSDLSQVFASLYFVISTLNEE